MESEVLVPILPFLIVNALTGLVTSKWFIASQIKNAVSKGNRMINEADSPDLWDRSAESAARIQKWLRPIALFLANVGLVSWLIAYKLNGGQ